MLQSLSNAAATHMTAATNLAPAPLRVAFGVANSMLRPRQLVEPAGEPEVKAVSDAGGRVRGAMPSTDRMVPARPPEHQD